MDYGVREKDGVMNGGTSGIMVGYYEPLGCYGYLILRYARGVGGRGSGTRRLLPLDGAARHVRDALDLSPASGSQCQIGGRGEEVKGQQQQNRP